MPYIKQEQRPELDEALKSLIEALKASEMDQIDGKLNYSITKILKSVYPQNYFSMNRALGVLTAIQLEYYRMDVAPYEDIKIRDNGSL